MFKLIVPLLSLLITVSGCTQMVVIPEAKGPYDPRPLMAKLTAKNKDNKDRMHFLVFGDSKHSPRLQTVLKRADALTPEFCITTADLVKTGGGSQGVKDYQKLDKEAGWFFKKYPTTNYRKVITTTQIQVMIWMVTTNLQVSLVSMNLNIVFLMVTPHLLLWIGPKYKLIPLNINGWKAH